MDNKGKRVGIITPMDFTRYKQLNYNASYGDKADAEDTVTKMLEYMWINGMLQFLRTAMVPFPAPPTIFLVAF